MSRLRSMLALVLGLAGMLGRSRAATYYVDYAGGADANSGRTLSAPFQHCPGDARAGGQAAVRLAPGDTVIFKGGVTYLGGIDCPSDDVTYEGNSAGGFGTGRPVIDGQHDPVQNKGFTAIGRSGLSFRNLEIGGYGGHGDQPWTGMENRGRYGYGLYLDGCTRITVSRCLFRDIGDWRNLAQANEGYMEGVGVAVIDSGSAIAVTDCEFTRIGRAGVMIEPKQGTRICRQIQITGNEFHEFLRWGVWLSTGNTHCTLQGVTIDGNRFHDIYQYAVGQWLGRPGDAPHVDCIIAYIGSLPPQGGQILGTAADPIIIRNNAFYNNALVERVQNAALFLDTWGGRVLIYNNVFVNVLFDGNGAVFCLEGTDTTINPAPDYWIANNSFYDSIYAVSLESERYPLKRGCVRIVNNIFCQADAGAGYAVRVMDANSIPAQLDYNLYATGRPDGELAFTPVGHLTLAQLRRRRCELHGRQGDPPYRDIAPGLGAASSADDLHLRADSPAIAAALNLSALFSTDRDGRPRPVSSPWDCGAFQYAPAAK